MRPELSYFIVIVGLTLVVASSQFPQKWRHLRKKICLSLLGLCLLSTVLLLSVGLQNRPFFIAVTSGDIERVRELLSKRPALIRARTIWENETALHLAVAAGRSEMVAFLLRSGADVSARDASEITPLHEAAFYGNTSVAEVLLKAGADVNAIGYRDKDTPLCVAAAHGNLDVAKLLLANGALVNVANVDGKTPLQLAREEHHTNVVTLLTLPSSQGKGEEQPGNHH